MVDDPKLLSEAVLRWYLEAGVDEAILEHPVDRYLPSESMIGEPSSARPPRAKRMVAPGETQPADPLRQPLLPAFPAAAQRPVSQPSVESAMSVAGRATSLDELRAALLTFDGCPLSATATRLVFGDGNAQARVVLVGEAPGAEEDRRGLPFVGPSGRLLDRMLASIGFDRNNVFITNTIFWRPPGNRSPNSGEVATCMPFVERILELINPALLVALGGPAAAALLGQTDSVGRMRGRWFTYQTPRMPRPITATVLFHPAYLLRTPAQKRLAWRDLLAIKARISAD